LNTATEGNSPSIELVKDGDAYFELTLALIELSITNKNVRTIASLAKSVYSCKNILKRGKKREFIKRFLK
jgi:hypothetical protein